MPLPPLPTPKASVSEELELDSRHHPTAASASISPPLPAPSTGPSESRQWADDQIETRSVRSSSSASRNANRLSLTLPIPIALPTSNPSRPTPATSSLSSCPPTPVDTPGLGSPIDPNDFITAIAAQERRVLELREELGRAEDDLRRLKREWMSHGKALKRADTQRIQPLRSMSHKSEASTPDDEDVVRRNHELERRKALLLGQQSAPGTPTQSKRRVFRGGHTRALSLLSPTKSECDFSVHEDTVDQLKTSSKELDETFASMVQYAPVTPAQLSKRASWAPRSVHQQATSGVKQIAEDFKAGLWTFVEDIRQATVGDEPITGNGRSMRSYESSARSALSITSFADGQETIRPTTTSNRPHVSKAFEEETPTPASRFGDVLQDEGSNGNNRQQRRCSKAAVAADKATIKRFSWTPLTVDSYDDSDWSSWDSPMPAKSPRWSGTTVTGDMITTIPEKIDDFDAQKHPANPLTSSPLSPSKFEELAWPALTNLTPNKLKQHASNFVKELEKSLTPPGATIAVNVDDKVKGM